MTNKWPRFLHVLLIAFVAPCIHATAPGEGIGELESPDWWLEQALRHVSTIDNANVRSDTNYDLAFALARNGDLSEAADVADDVTNAQRRVYAQTFVAKHYLEQGKETEYLVEMQRAQRFVLKAENASEHIFINLHLVGAYMEADHPAEAMHFAQEIPDKRQQHFAYVNIAEELAKRGKLVEAYTVVSDHVRSDWQDSAWTSIAYASARAGKIDDVRTAIKRLTEEKQRDNTYKHLVEALLQADRVADAQEYAAKILDPIHKATAHAAVLAKLAEKDGVATLQSRVAKAKSREEKLQLYQLLVDKCVADSKVAEAESAIEALVQVIEASPRDPVLSKFGMSNDDISKALAKSHYLKTARLLAEQGNRAAGLQRISWARKPIIEMTEAAGVFKSTLVPQLIVTQIELGDLQGAREVLGAIEGEFSKSDAAKRIAIALIKAGDYQSAATVADFITYPMVKGRAVGAVAAEWIRAGRLDCAKDLLNKLDPSSGDVHAYRAVGKAMIDLGHGGELKRWVAEMPSPAARVFACIGAAEGLSND